MKPGISPRNGSRFHARVEHAALGRERGGDVGQRELEVPLGGVAVGVDELVLVEVDDGRDCGDAEPDQPSELGEIEEGRCEDEVEGLPLGRRPPAERARLLRPS